MCRAGKSAISGRISSSFEGVDSTAARRRTAVWIPRWVTVRVLTRAVESFTAVVVDLWTQYMIAVVVDVGVQVVGREALWQRQSQLSDLDVLKVELKTTTTMVTVRRTVETGLTTSWKSKIWSKLSSKTFLGQNLFYHNSQICALLVLVNKLVVVPSKHPGPSLFVGSDSVN